MRLKFRLFLLALPIILLISLYINWGSGITVIVQKTILWAFVAISLVAIDHFSEHRYSAIANRLNKVSGKTWLKLFVTVIVFTGIKFFLGNTEENLGNKIQQTLSFLTWWSVANVIFFYLFKLMSKNWIKGYFLFIPLIALYMPFDFFQENILSSILSLDIILLLYTVAYCGIFSVTYFFREISEESHRIQQEKIARDVAAGINQTKHHDMVENFELAAYNLLIKHSTYVYSKISQKFGKTN